MSGDSARTMSGWAATSLHADHRQHREPDQHDRPEQHADAPVPNRCSANSAIRIASENGTIWAASAGDATCRPDTADTTEMAGVSMPSP